MKIAIVGGGTLGHIVPGLILGSNLAKKHEIIYITTKKDKRFNIFNKHKYLKKVYYIDSSGLSKNILTNIKIFFKDLKAMYQINKIVNSEQIDLLIGMGGYISGLTIFVANNLNIKTMIHEQNSVMGLANKLNLKKTNKLLLSYEDNTLKKYQDKITIIPNPRYTDALTLNKLNNKKHILITSGTNGSKFINTIMCDLLNIYDFPKYTITFITGKKYYDDVVKNIIKKPNIQILPFTNDLLKEMNLSSLVISRAGSSSLYEILGLKKLSIIIPSPNVTNNHQYYNAMEIVTNGLGEIISDDDVIKKIHKVNNHYNDYVTNIKRYKKKYNLNKIINIIEEELISIN